MDKVDAIMDNITDDASLCVIREALTAFFTEEKTMDVPVQNYVTDENYAVFKAEYDKAVGEGRSDFWFEDQKVFTKYAEHIIQYVEKYS